MILIYVGPSAFSPGEEGQLAIPEVHHTDKVYFQRKDRTDSVTVTLPPCFTTSSITLSDNDPHWAEISSNATYDRYQYSAPSAGSFLLKEGGIATQQTMTGDIDVVTGW